MKTKFKISDKVKWFDPSIDDYSEEERNEQISRVYEIVAYLGHDTYLIVDDYGESEVYGCELKKVE